MSSSIKIKIGNRIISHWSTPEIKIIKKNSKKSQQIVLIGQPAGAPIFDGSGSRTSLVTIYATMDAIEKLIYKNK